MGNMKNIIDQLHEMMKKLDSKQLAELGISINNEISYVLEHSTIDKESKLQIIQLLHNHQIHDHILIKMALDGVRK